MRTGNPGAAFLNNGDELSSPNDAENNQGGPHFFALLHIFDQSNGIGPHDLYFFKQDEDLCWTFIYFIGGMSVNNR